VGAQLLAGAGGLSALSRAPSCNGQVMGSKRRTSGGGGGGGGAPRAAAAAAVERPHKHAGVIFECALVTEAPHALQRRAAKTLAAKVVLAARMDAFGEGRGGGGGAALLAGVAAKVAKWQEPPPPRAHKPLKAPDEVKKKRRGGRRARAMREKLGVTDVRREANRLAVSGGHHEYGDFSMGVEAGMLGTGATATGRLRVEAKAQKRILGAGAAKRLKSAGAFGGGAAAGTLSTFDFTAPQGMEFVAGGWAGGRAPRSAAATAGAGSVFDNSGTFSAMPH
jgi:U4/U6 small nuclear ribonucleoprotein PRP31